MLTRRTVIATSMAATICGPSWAEVGAASYLSAAKVTEDQHSLFGLKKSGEIAFEVPLPERGHAAAAHPLKAEAVAFARRPGRFAMVIDCASGEVRHRLSPPEGRHFYGHGAFTADGSVLLTTENDIHSGMGRIGLWSVNENYRRMGEVSSGGIGPHDIIRLPGGDFAVANGGIRTHPDTGRQKLNLSTMRPNLTYLDSDLRIATVVEPDDEMRQSSIRHLAVNRDGLVAAAMQWQGDLFEAPPLLALSDGNGPLQFADEMNPAWRGMNGYAGSISFNADGDQVAVTSPRGGVTVGFTLTGAKVLEVRAPDVCGLAPMGRGFLVSNGTGKLMHLDPAGTALMATTPVSWDNHIVPL